MSILLSIDLDVNLDDPSVTDLDGYLAAVAGRDEWDFDGPTPDEVLREPWASWPEWTQTERWTLAGEPDEPEAFALPVGVERNARRTASGSDFDQCDRPGFYT